MTGHSIFRSKALRQYLQTREKTILPLFIAPPVFALYWLLLGIFVMSGLIAWFGQVPLYVSGAGLILSQSPTINVNRQSPPAIALIFLPASSPWHLQAGASALVQVDSTGSQFNGTVESINPDVFSPSEVQKQYAYRVFTSVLVVSIQLRGQGVSNLYAGNPVSAQIQVGSQRLIALFPVLNVLLKDK